MSFCSFLPLFLLALGCRALRAPHPASSVAPEAKISWNRTIGHFGNVNPRLFATPSSVILADGSWSSTTGVVTAYSADTGSLEWHWSDVASCDGEALFAASSSAGAFVRAKTQSRNISVVHAVTGTEIGQFSSADQVRHIYLCNRTTIVFTDNGVQAFNVDSTNWQKAGTFLHPVACCMDGDHAILLAPGLQGKKSSLFKIRLATGEILFTAMQPTYSQLHEYSAASDDWIAVSTSTTVTILNSSTGTVLFNHSVSSTDQINSVAVTSLGNFYVSGIDMNVDQGNLGNNYPGFLVSLLRNESSSVVRWGFSTEGTMTAIGLDHETGDALLTTSGTFYRFERATGRVRYEIRHLQNYNANDRPVHVPRFSTDIFTGDLQESRTTSLVAVKK